MRKILFLCTGNYYRSRFAEYLFNHLAPQVCPGWEATSRALAIELGGSNVGPISPFAKAALTELGISLSSQIRMPAQVVLEELEMADHVIAMKTAEHRPMLEARFTEWSARHLDKVEFWDIDDVQFLAPKIALRQIESNVRTLCDRFR